jgi:glyoxylase-like metal-dependent hydrolase (beta-lactamase superfamily II)
MPRDAPDFDYPFANAPAPGELVDIDDGVRWLRMPLPFVLQHINLWLLEDAGGHAIVDTGVSSDETQELWDRIIDAPPVDGRLSRVIVTHMHPDHVGMAGWLCDQYDLDLSMTRAEYLMCRVLAADTGRAAPDEGIAFYRAAGFDDDAIGRYRQRFGGFGKAVSALPDSFHRLREGDRLDIGALQWRIITTSGHCPEHASLYCESKNLLIAGDQLLPTISSNVSVWPTEPEADPLADWLAACRRLRQELPEDVLVLPSHGKPFRNAHERLDALIDEHEQGLDKLVELCESPKRVVDTFPALFRARISDGNLIMATGEARAHLNYLVQRDQVVVERDPSGVDWYRRA